MKLAALRLVLPLLLAGCASTRSQQATLEEFRQTVLPRLPEAWTCEPVREFDGRRFFVVEHRPYEIQVTATELITQEEWDVRYARSMASIERLTKSSASSGEVERVMQDAAAGFQLPDGRYEGIGVRVNVQTPEYSYPELESDGRAADQIAADIMSLLKPYRKAINPMQRTGLTPRR